MALRIDDDACIGCGLCPAICPRAFAMKEDTSVAVVTDADAVGADVDEAIESCPTNAIIKE